MSDGFLTNGEVFIKVVYGKSKLDLIFDHLRGDF